MTSHPDDESMFFGPMLLCRDYHQEVHLLCLSNGDADGLGAVRTKELEAAVEHLGVPAKNVRTLDRPELRDGMDELWPAEALPGVPHEKTVPIAASRIFVEALSPWRPWAVDTLSWIGLSP